MKNPFIIFKRWGTSAQNDWRAMFSIFLVLILASIIWSFSMFALVRDTSSEEWEGGGEILNIQALRRAALHYDAKAAQFDLVKSTPETTPDPSK